MKVARRQAGFSLPEVLIVILIGLIITTIALPNMLTLVANTRLRSNISSLSGVFQNCRMMAVKNNRTMTTRFITTTSSTTNTGLTAYVKSSTDTSDMVAADPQVRLEAPIVKYTTPTGTSAPTGVTSTTLGFTAQTGDTSFNSRGLPCTYSSGTCSNAGFIYYFKDTRRSGSSGWAAVSISPAGRIRKWFWSGTTWTE